MNTQQLLGFAAVIYAVQASGYSDLLADLQYLYNIDQYQKTLPVSDYYPDDPYSSNKVSADDWGVAYPDTLSDPKELRDYGETALRDQEYMKQLPISGYQFISGGTGRQEDPSEVKTDKVLPAYCTPPNPCPFGYTGEDNCVKDFENTPERNRQMLEEQDCPCDAEHMLSCPPGKKTIDPKSGFVSDGMGTADSDDLASLGDSLGSLDDIDLSENPYLSMDTKRQKLVAKKSPHFIKKRDNSERFSDMFPFNLEDDLEMNPYLYGQQKSVAAKKQAPNHMIK